MSDYILVHHGIKGQKWGVRRFQNPDGTRTEAGKKRYESPKSVKQNRDGSLTYPKGFTFNRVGQSSLDINKSGGLYVSYGVSDAQRYIRNLGPTTFGKLLGTAATTMQKIEVTSPLKVPSHEQFAKETAEFLLQNKNVVDSFNDSMYAFLYSERSTVDKWGRLSMDDVGINKDDIINAYNNPHSKEAQYLAYGINSFFGDPNYKEETRQIYDHFRSKNYDAVPDIHDRLSGTGETSMVVINTNKVKLTDAQPITKEDLKNAKIYIKSVGDLPISEVLKK